MLFVFLFMLKIGFPKFQELFFFNFEELLLNNTCMDTDPGFLVVRVHSSDGSYCMVLLRLNGRHMFCQGTPGSVAWKKILENFTKVQNDCAYCKQHTGVFSFFFSRILKVPKYFKRFWYKHVINTWLKIDLTRSVFSWSRRKWRPQLWRPK